MPESFHPFPWLPLELRLMIWTFVLQPRVPGVHIFGTDYGKYNSNNGYVAPSDDFARPLNRGYGVKQLTAPTPRARPAASTTPEPSWTTNNPSSYLIDGGLWTACQESRAVIEQEYEAKRWPAFTNAELSSFDYRGSTNRKRAIFEGVDRRFVEVVGCHIGAEHMHDEFETDSGSLEFYEAVEKAATWQENNENNSDLIGSYGRAHFGILACELL
ncbi:hypothetical protein CEP53_001712 [Fusarium sp. AF-6]|nr:hypothetical protein CEP53_001712 [Fusarium sp. AF-6]